MQLVIIRSNKLKTFFLPSKVFGNYWIQDDNKTNLINVEASENRWVLRSNDDIKIVNKDHYLDSIYLLNYSYCFLKSLKTGETLVVYCMPTYDDTSVKLGVNNNTELTIGSDEACTICYENQNVAPTMGKIKYVDNKWTLSVVDAKLSYLNGYPVKDAELKIGDKLFIM